jgi:outer membrane murein-binding lipoprotein Lpp
MIYFWIPLLLLTGCASQSDVEYLEERINILSQGSDDYKSEIAACEIDREALDQRMDDMANTVAWLKRDVERLTKKKGKKK